MTPAIGILLAIAALHAADVATTVIGLKRPGESEANPIGRWAFKLLGPLPGAVALKLVLSVPVVAVGLLYPRWWPALLAYALSLAWVVRSNLKEIRRKPDA